MYLSKSVTNQKRIISLACWVSSLVEAVATRNGDKRMSFPHCVSFASEFYEGCVQILASLPRLLQVSPCFVEKDFLNPMNRQH